MRQVIAALALTLASCHPAVAGTPYVSVGYHAALRDQSYDVTAGWLSDRGLGVEVGFENMGRQPPGFPNINKFVTLNLVGRTKFYDWLYGYGKGGIHTSKYSYNGTNDYDRSGDSLIGYQAAVGLETPVYKDSVMLYAQYTVYEYRQVNNPNMGGFHKPSIGIRVHF
jgi:hypothetical protein